MDEIMDGEKFQMLHDLNQATSTKEISSEPTPISTEEQHRLMELDKKKRSLFQLLDELFGEIK